MSIKDNLFINIAKRLNKEPKFSDMIWIMCKTINYFQEIFLEYCFDEKIIVLNEIIREFPRGDSQPDFYFKDDNKKEYIIENKINDRGDHFEQYINTFPKAKRAFIANYKEPEHEGWKVKTWREFLKYLNKKITPENITEEEYEFINGFTYYIKSVIKYTEVKSMDLSKISEFSNFYNVISEIISDNKKFVFYDYNPPSTFTRFYFGKGFFYNKNVNQGVYLWLGLYISEDPGVYIKFPHYKDNNYVPEDERKKLEEMEEEGEYFDKVSTEDGELFIHLKDEYFKKLCIKSDLIEQKSIIENFLEEIMNILKS